MSLYAENMCLFIGGILDGERIHVPIEFDHFRAAVPPSDLPKKPSDDFQTFHSTIDVHGYTAIHFRNSSESRVFVFDQIPLSQRESAATQGIQSERLRELAK